MKYLLSIAALLLLGACAGTVVKDPTTGAMTVNLAAGTLEVKGHADVLAAAALANASAATATKNGDTALAAAYTARANKWLAIDVLVTAHEAQISACANALLAMKPTLPSLPADAGPATKLEAAAEALGNLKTGLSPAAQLACAAIPLPFLPPLK